MRRYLLVLLFVCLSALVLSCSRDNAGNGKKVYADYHGVRYTREHDGKLGRWEMYADTRKSSTGRKSLCYTADLVDSSGRRQIAATAYPLTGMQSNLDEYFIEYQILQAKTAHIDGFFIEWGFLPHENDLLLKAMQKVAAKYNFEIGVNWCDGWIYYNWISKIYPQINTREEKTKYMGKCYQYLIDSVLYAPTAPVVSGHPVFYHFGPGATVEEFALVKKAARLPEGRPEPVGLRRWADWGRLENGKYVAVRQSREMDAWIEAGEIPTPWIPARVRERDEAHPHWDYYAKPEDLIAFMEPFRDSVWLSGKSSYIIKSGFVMPGMDNRGCAGWGRGHFFLIPRNDGRTYRNLWDFCMESSDSLDMVFIASWSDYTEGHEIEPTVENGYRELIATSEYASRFKGLPQSDTSGMYLPLKLFQAREKCRFLSDCGADTGRICLQLDRTARLVSKGKYDAAARLLEKCRKELASLENRIVTNTFTLEDCDRTVNLEENLASVLTKGCFNCTIEFEYLDKGSDFLFIRSSRQASDGTEVMGKLRTDDSLEWKDARMEISGRMFDFSPDRPHIRFCGNVEVRNIRIRFETFALK